MSWPCPNGCPRDGGDYCERHVCECCAETLKPVDGLRFCKLCDELCRIPIEDIEGGD